MAKGKNIRNFFNSQKEPDTPAFVASATDDVLPSELLIVENKIQNINPSKTTASQCPKKDQNRGWNICSDSWNQSFTQAFQQNLSKVYFS